MPRHNAPQLDLTTSIGIATGRIFCGVYGGEKDMRMEYCILGETVNLSARLMGVSSVWCFN
jgi:class 3 adenylate cyclase